MELKIPPLILVLLFGLGMVFAAKLCPFLTLQLPLRAPFGAFIMAIGAVIVLTCALNFRKNNTTLDPRNPNKSNYLVTTGLYSLSRNPMYLGFFVVLSGLFVALANGAAGLFVPAFVLYMNRFQITPEERLLLQRFGDPYSSYCRLVRRWI